MSAEETKNSQSELLVRVSRSGLTERQHRGFAVVVDGSRNIIYSLGDAHHKTYMRSCAKPIQSLPLVMTGAADHFQLTHREIALICSSHYAEEEHRQVLVSIMSKSGLDEGKLRCGTKTSLKLDYAFELARRGEPLNQLFNDCSGKHLGMLLLCIRNNWILEDYLAPDHPVQQLIKKTLAEFCVLDEDELAAGIDGCSAPVFYLPLINMACAFNRLANPGLCPEKFRTASERIFASMTEYPQMVAGSGGFCTALMRVTGGRMVAKIGAEGVYCVGICKQRIGLAVKIEDGRMDVLSTVVIRLLEKLDLISSDEVEQLASFYRRPVLNDLGLKVGIQEALF